MDTIEAKLSDYIYIEKSAIPVQLQRDLHQIFVYSNPEFYKKQRLGFSTWQTPRSLTLHFSKFIDGQFQDNIMFPLGMLDEVAEYLSKSQKTINLADNTVLHPHEYQSKIKLLDFQEVAVAEVLKHQYGILQGKCGCGKTVCGLEIAARLGQKTLVIVHTEELLKQWADRARTFLGVEAGMWSGKHKKIKPFTVGLIKSVLNSLDQFRDTFGTVIFDEAHHVPASTFYDVATKIRSHYRYGLTATPKRKDGKTFYLHAALGPVRHKIEKEVIQEAGITIPSKIKVVMTNFRCDEFLDESSDHHRDYHFLRQKMIVNVERIKLVYRHLSEEIKGKHKILMLFDRFNFRSAADDADTVNLIEKWRSWLEARGHRVKVITGYEKQDLNKIAVLFEAGQLDVLIASTVADEGLDLPVLDRIFICMPCKGNAGLLEQRIGRIERKHHGKKDAVAYYFLDRHIFGDNTYGFKKFSQHVEVIE